MANYSNSNQINVPEAREAMRSMKHEVANELGITLNQGYNGNISAKDAGHIGGNMVKNVLPVRTREHHLELNNRFIGRKRMKVGYIARVVV